MKMKTPAALLLLSAFALAQHQPSLSISMSTRAGCRSREVGMDPASSKSVVRAAIMNGGKDTTNSGVKATNVADLTKSVAETA